MGACSRASMVRTPASPSDIESSTATSAPLYDCDLAASHAAHAVTGGQVLNIQPLREGYVGYNKSGNLYLELNSCYVGSKATVIQFTWTKRSAPLELTLPIGPIRFVRLSYSDSQASLRIVDDRGRKATLRAVKIPSDIVCYCRNGHQNVFYNFDQPKRPDREVAYISIVDTNKGPSLRSDFAP